jgi:hypothetical protein
MLASTTKSWIVTGVSSGLSEYWKMKSGTSKYYKTVRTEYKLEVNTLLEEKPNPNSSVSVNAGYET